MKTIILSILLLNSLSAFTQQLSNISLKEELLRKSKNQKTAGWIMLGGGVALAAGGVLILSDAINNGEDGLSLSGPFVSLIGVSSMVGSIPMFAASARNRKKAVGITAGTQQIIAPVNGGWAYQYQPALSVKIPLGMR
ncbi:hypothetical protein BH10BAC2_BH10BAC2_00840 [soil metagenome]